MSAVVSRIAPAFTKPSEVCDDCQSTIYETDDKVSERSTRISVWEIEQRHRIRPHTDILERAPRHSSVDFVTACPKPCEEKSVLRACITLRNTGNVVAIRV